MTGILGALEALGGLFESMSLPYAVMGGIAVRVYALPRPTYDVDFTLAIARERLPELYDAVRKLQITVPDAYERGWVDTVAGMPVVKFRLYLQDHGIDIDVFLAESDFQQQLLTRRRRVDVNGFSAWVVSPEDLILLKLIASRYRDVSDVQDILLVQGRLDVEYMRQWADQLDIRERLDEALANQYGTG